KKTAEAEAERKLLERFGAKSQNSLGKAAHRPHLERKPDVNTLDSVFPIFGKVIAKLKEANLDEDSILQMPEEKKLAIIEALIEKAQLTDIEKALIASRIGHLQHQFYIEIAKIVKAQDPSSISS